MKRQASRAKAIRRGKKYLRRLDTAERTGPVTAAITGQVLGIQGAFLEGIDALIGRGRSGRVPPKPPCP